MIDPATQKMIKEMIASGKYRAIIWAGGYGQHLPHSQSDTDLYAISTDEWPEHWCMERVDGHRIELTVYTLEQWNQILSETYRHPKHHYTFANGKVLFDPEGLCSPLLTLAGAVLAKWITTQEQMEELRYGLTIQHDKTLGYHEKKMPLHLRYHAIGIVHLACELLVHLWDGYAVDGGKNLTRVLSHPSCPTEVQALLSKLLTSPDTEEMADAAILLCQRCLELTGGVVNSHHGGIPR